MSPVGAALLTLVLLNPFCCHLLPHYEVEFPGSGSVMTQQDGVCIGKPEVVRERTVQIAPVLWFLLITLGVRIFAMPRRIFHCRWTDLIRHGGPRRHKVCSVFLL